MLVSSQLYTVILDLIPPFMFYCNLFYSSSAAKDITVLYGDLRCAFFLDHIRQFSGCNNSSGNFSLLFKKKKKRNILWAPQLSKGSFLPICVLHPLAAPPLPHSFSISLLPSYSPEPHSAISWRHHRALFKPDWLAVAAVKPKLHAWWLASWLLLFGMEKVPNYNCSP